jgi:diketogulonate reductase-like aldo/keto reductase
MNEGVIAAEVAQIRGEVFIASKIPPKEEGYEKTKAAVEKSLKVFGGEMDMMLLTFPGTAGMDPKDEKNKENREDSWRALEEFVVAGKIKNIGVANFKPRHLESLLKIAWIKPVVNQIELHPLYQEHDTLDLCKQ